MTSAQRQQKFRERRANNGLVPVTVFVPAGAAAEIKQLAAQLCHEPSSRPVSISLQDSKTGRMKGVKLR
jgi:hypothetical protein